jgi:hypothetical protein
MNYDPSVPLPMFDAGAPNFTTQQGLTLIAPEPEYLLQIVDAAHEPIIVMDPQGRIKLLKEGAEYEAAVIFWDAVDQRGVDIRNARILKLETALKTIQKWDMLNPPNTLIGDLPWLKRLVEDALALQNQ